MSYSRVLVVAIVVLGCHDSGRSSSTAAGSAAVELASDADYVKAALAATVEVTAIFQAAGKDCDKLAADLAAFATRKQSTIQAIARYERAHPEAKDTFDEQSTEQAEAYRAVSYPAVAACRDHREVIDAIRRASGEVLEDGSGSGAGVGNGGRKR